jgi:putative colanic acid biosynthesis acetyltransferase WcaF
VIKRDRNPFPTPHSLANRAARAVWGAVWLVLFRPSPRVFHGWRRWLLRVFGAHIETGVHVYPSARIWAPWKLQMDAGSCLGSNVDCYNVGGVTVGAYTTVSQYCYLCGATYDYTKRAMPLIARPIRLGEWVWIGADVYVGPGVTIGDGCVVGARSSVHSDLEAWTVAVGNPAKPIKRRTFEGQPAAVPLCSPPPPHPRSRGESR